MSFALALDAAVGALRSRRTAPAKVTAEERLSEQRLGQLVVRSRACCRCWSVALSQDGASQGNREERLSEQRAFCKPRARLARRNAQARVVAEAEVSAANFFEQRCASERCVNAGWRQPR